MNTEVRKKEMGRISGRIRKMVAASLLGIMLIGSAVAANAAEHKCNFSLKESPFVYRVYETAHPYTVVENYKTVIKSCKVKDTITRTITKCACGATIITDSAPVTTCEGKCKL